MKDIPAFPTPRHTRHFDDSQGAYIQDDGMTLRDYFAARAMQSMLNNSSNYESVAKYAYKMADAMMKAREA